MVDGKRKTYDWDELSGMYHYLENKGELYFIEVLEGEQYIPIGDVTFWQEDMPIVIGDRNWRGKNIGHRVIYTLVQRGKELGYRYLEVAEIYDWNVCSRHCFESIGFRACEKTEKGYKYRLVL